MGFFSIKRRPILWLSKIETKSLPSIEVFFFRVSTKKSRAESMKWNDIFGSVSHQWADWTEGNPRRVAKTSRRGPRLRSQKKKGRRKQNKKSWNDAICKASLSLSLSLWSTSTSTSKQGDAPPPPTPRPAREPFFFPSSYFILFLFFILFWMSGRSDGIRVKRRVSRSPTPRAPFLSFSFSFFFAFFFCGPIRFLISKIVGAPPKIVFFLSNGPRRCRVLSSTLSISTWSHQLINSTNRRIS